MLMLFHYDDGIDKKKNGNKMRYSLWMYMILKWGMCPEILILWLRFFMSLYFELVHEVVCLYVTCPTLWCGMSVGPSPPEITNLTVLGSRSIYLAWEAPKQFYRTIDHYYIEIRDTSTNLKQRRALENNEREVSFNSYVIKHSWVNRHDCRFQSIYLQRFLILSAVELKSNQSRKDCSYV